MTDIRARGRGPYITHCDNDFDHNDYPGVNGVGFSFLGIHVRVCLPFQQGLQGSYTESI